MTGKEQKGGDKMLIKLKNNKKRGAETGTP
jgi:hypothetical protein